MTEFSFRANPIGSNQVEIRTQRYRILCSFGIPVAYEDMENRKYFRTEKEFPKPTEKHIIQFLEGVKDWSTKTQDELEELLKEGNIQSV